MQLKVSLIVLALLLFCKANSQLIEGNWLAGGSASFNSSKYDITNGLTSTLGNVQLSGDVGYFVKDKLVLGLKPGYSRSTVNSPYSKVETYDFGPFIRYYILEKEKTVNIFSELMYQYGFTRSNQVEGISNRNRFGGNAGFVAFFNSAVALEFSLGYSYVLYNNNSGNVSTISSTIGFHFHFIK